MKTIIKLFTVWNVIWFWAMTLLILQIVTKEVSIAGIILLTIYAAHTVQTSLKKDEIKDNSNNLDTL